MTILPYAMRAGLSANARMTKQSMQLLGSDDETIFTTDHRLFSSMPQPIRIDQLTGHVFAVHWMCLWFLCVDVLFVDTEVDTLRCCTW